MNALTRIEPAAAALIPYNDIERMGRVIAQSGLFGVKTPEQAIALMLIAQAEGLHPAIAARDYHVIQGRPCLRADAMLARFQQSGGKVVWDRYDDEAVTGTFSHPVGGTVTVTWTLDMARKASLAGKDVWKSFPRSMLRARCISEGIRTVFPGVVAGMYAPEEIRDIPQIEEPAPVTAAPAKPSSRAATLKRQVAETLVKSGALPPPDFDSPAPAIDAAFDAETGEVLPPAGDFDPAAETTLAAVLEAISLCRTKAEVMEMVGEVPDSWPEADKKKVGVAMRARIKELNGSNGAKGSPADHTNDR